MAPGSCTCRSPCVNTLVDPARELDKLAGASDLAKISNAGSNETFTEALTLPKAYTSPFVPPTSENLFTQFMKVFMETIQARD